MEDVRQQQRRNGCRDFPPDNPQSIVEATRLGVTAAMVLVVDLAGIAHHSNAAVGTSQLKLGIGLPCPYRLLLGLGRRHVYYSLIAGSPPIHVPLKLSQLSNQHLQPLNQRHVPQEPLPGSVPQQMKSCQQRFQERVQERVQEIRELQQTGR